MIFQDRADAGRQLATRLAEFARHTDAIVLGIPRGGVIVAYEIAQALHLPLDIFLSHKLGVPGQEELAFGAVAAGGVRYLDEELIRAEDLSPDVIERITAQIQQLLDQSSALYRGDRPSLDVAGQTVILVDDGIATGASAYASIHALRQMNPVALILATPIAPESTCVWLRVLVDHLVCVHAPRDFHAVGRFYRCFPQVSDAEIIPLLGTR
jgi:putative phosphoribosyl transferase